MSKKKELTKLERIVLSHLELNARLPLTKIAKKAKKSQQLVSYKVNYLLNKKFLKKFYTIIDYSKLNVMSFYVLFKVSYIQKHKINDLIIALTNHNHTAIVITCGGRYDIICSFLSRNASEFNKMLKHLISEYPDQLKNYIVLTGIVNRDFGRKHLLGSYYKTEQIIFGGDRVPENIDKTDFNILKSISQNARISSGNMAKEIDIGAKTILNRIKSLEKKEIILGYKPMLNLSLIDYSSMYILLKYHNVSPYIEDELVEFLKNHPNIPLITKTLGEWDIMIKVEVTRSTELRKIEVEIRKKFALLIQDFEIIPLYTEFKKDFFPRFIEANIKE